MKKIVIGPIYTIFYVDCWWVVGEIAGHWSFFFSFVGFVGFVGLTGFAINLMLFFSNYTANCTSCVGSVDWLAHFPRYRQPFQYSLPSNWICFFEIYAFWPRIVYFFIVCQVFVRGRNANPNLFPWIINIKYPIEHKWLEFFQRPVLERPKSLVAPLRYRFLIVFVDIDWQILIRVCWFFLGPCQNWQRHLPLTLLPWR